MPRRSFSLVPAKARPRQDIHSRLAELHAFALALVGQIVELRALVDPQSSADWAAASDEVKDAVKEVLACVNTPHILPFLVVALLS